MIIEIILASYFLAVILNILIVRNRHLLTARRLIKLLAKWAGCEDLLWKPALRLPPPPKFPIYIESRDLERFNINTMFDERKFTESYIYYHLHMQTSMNVNEAMMYEFIEKAGNAFKEFLTERPHLVKIYRDEHNPRRYDNPTYDFNFWIRRD